MPASPWNLQGWMQWRMSERGNGQFGSNLAALVAADKPLMMKQFSTAKK